MIKELKILGRDLNGYPYYNCTVNNCSVVILYPRSYCAIHSLNWNRSHFCTLYNSVKGNPELLDEIEEAWNSSLYSSSLSKFVKYMKVWWKTLW